MNVGIEKVRALRETYSETGILGLFEVMVKGVGMDNPAPILKAKIMANAPFEVGQKVVALKSSERVLGVIKGTVYTVAYNAACPDCKIWHTGIKELIGRTDKSLCRCGSIISHPGRIEYCGYSKYFAPIPEQYADMTAEIAQQFKEHHDTVDQPVKVLETVN